MVAGSADAAIGSSICRSGRTTGRRFGTLLGRDETVVYAPTEFGSVEAPAAIRRFRPAPRADRMILGARGGR